MRNMRFTNKDLENMIVPLFFEQLLVMLVGIADTLVISYAGEAAVSGVSLVNQFNTIFIYIFTALASGGAVVVSQYIGSRDTDNAEKSSGQLLMFSILLSLVVGALVLIGNRTMLGILFGKVEDSVMEACVTYLRISAYSYPALAIYNAGAAIYRSLGKTKVTMYISILSNIINVVGNIIGVFGLKAGVAGVAYPSLIARAFSAVVITFLCFRQGAELRYRNKWIFTWNGGMLKKILNIAVPNGVENGLFQLVKVALSSIVALFGTYQIAANGVAQSLWSLAALMGVAMSSAFIPVIGQCMGANETDEAEYYFKKLMKITVIASVAWNVIILAATPLAMMVYDLSAETKRLIIWLVVIHNAFNAFAYPFSGPLSAGLRAAGDAKFTMVVTVISTIGIRLLLSVLFGIVLNMGVIGIAFAMCADWLFKAVLFEIRFRKGVWKQFKVI
ncbi:MAG: MATE family efflux transporter [Lachnospiraceae bacterium]|nr:MATE family efflux transporter [Lachnospiraceae bacterium]